MRETMTRVIGISLLCTVGFAGCAAGPPARDVEASVRAAQDTFTKVQADSEDAGFHDSLKKAKAILIVSPGIERGVALARSNSAQGWSGPAFYNVTMLGTGRGISGTGFSAGPQNLTLVALAVSDKALAWFMKPRLPGTDDLAVYTAAGTVTGTSRRVVANAAEADLLLFTTKPGAKEGAKSVAQFGSPFISVDASANQSYYGRAVTPADILMTQSVSNPSAAPLQKAIATSE